MLLSIFACCGTNMPLFTNNFLNSYCQHVNSTYSLSVAHVTIPVRNLHKHTCPYIMYGPKLFLVVFTNVRCLQHISIAYSLRITKLHISTKFHVLVNSALWDSSLQPEEEEEDEQFSKMLFPVFTPLPLSTGTHFVTILNLG